MKVRRDRNKVRTTNSFKQMKMIRTDTISFDFNPYHRTYRTLVDYVRTRLLQNRNIVFVPTFSCRKRILLLRKTIRVWKYFERPFSFFISCNIGNMCLAENKGRCTIKMFRRLKKHFKTLKDEVELNREVL